ncbi:MAG: lactonase family protein [Janthinobacterium lividum]
MKFNSICRIGAASVLSLAACLGLTACSRDYTVGFLYATSSRGTTAAPNGILNEFGIDYQTGSLIRLASSGQDSGGRNPVALAITSNQKTVFVVNRDDNNIVNFSIGTDGKLYSQKTVTVAGSYPVALGISGDSKFLYVLFTYQPGYTTANVGPGGMEIFPLTTDSTGLVSLGTPLTNAGQNYFPLGTTPIGIAVSANVSNTNVTATNGSDCTNTSCSSYVYVIEQDGRTTNNLLAFKRDLSSGAISAIGTTTIGAGTAPSTGYNSGILASAIVVGPLGNFLYVTDFSGNQVIGYSMSAGGIPTAITTGPFATQSQPSALTIDPRGKFLYVANYNASTVSPYAIAQGSGALSLTSGGPQATRTGPTCVTIENALGIYLYTSNFLDNSISGMQLNSATGNLGRVRNDPFTASAGPTCAAAIANGTHSSQIIQ